MTGIKKCNFNCEAFYNKIEASHRIAVGWWPGLLHLGSIS